MSYDESLEKKNVSIDRILWTLNPQENNTVRNFLNNLIFLNDKAEQVENIIIINLKHQKYLFKTALSHLIFEYLYLGLSYRNFANSKLIKSRKTRPG